LAALRRARGIRGEIVAENLGSDPDRFQDGLEATLLPSLTAGSGRPVELERAWMHQDQLVLKFVGIDSRTDAEALQGWFLCIPEEDRPPLEEGQVYLSDLVGCEVRAVSDDRRIGEVTGFQEIGPTVLLEVDGDDLLVPYVPEFCREVDLAGRVIRVELPEGLEDLNRK
jgi:16S rRNA processing protein RimM